MISVVLPAHDEEAYISSAVRDVAAGMRTRGEFEILVVENGSTDSTLEVARQLTDEVPELVVLSLGAADYGKALRHGLPRGQG